MKILTIEDEVLWQLKLQMMVEKMCPGAHIMVVDNCFDAQLYLQAQSPDLMLADILIDKTPVFDLFVPPYHTFPTVFITEMPTEKYYLRADALSNSTFLAKPFHELSLKSAIRTVAARAGQSFTNPEKGLPVVDKYRRRLQVPLAKVVWLESDGNYSIVHATDQKYIVKKSLTAMSHYLDEKFVQVQQSFIINSLYINHIDVGLNQVTVYGQIIPIGRRFREDFLNFCRDNRPAHFNWQKPL